ncbi:MAG: hypothetical protein MJ176_03590 [Treponema sp.]|nr:hypothetical protein [Treponema sp.]
MKKVFLALIIMAAAFTAFAASYKNNTYQKLADEYTKKAEVALDAGEYDDAIEYSRLAEENAELSKAYIASMLARKDAGDAIRLAENKIKYAESIQADLNFPMAFSSAMENLERAKKCFDDEDYENALSYARMSSDALAGIKEITPLPEYYIVKPWAETKDCYWNISGRPYVYNNPLLWENLYQANKQNMPKPEDPNLIHPGMKMKIPSITGEYRSGVYDPKKEYEPYSGK